MACQASRLARLEVAGLEWGDWREQGAIGLEVEQRRAATREGIEPWPGPRIIERCRRSSKQPEQADEAEHRDGAAGGAKDQPRHLGEPIERLLRDASFTFAHG